MENYIVRIYRRGGAEGLAGLVKAVETDEEKPFTSTDELLGLLNVKEDDGAENRDEMKNRSS